jgi:hypothetical protein
VKLYRAARKERQRRYAAGLNIIHPRVTPELAHRQRRGFVQRFRRYLDGVPNTD